jgi:hypothetical protein
MLQQSKSTDKPVGHVTLAFLVSSGEISQSRGGFYLSFHAFPKPFPVSRNTDVIYSLA